VRMGLAGVPQVEDLAFDADGGLFALVGRDDLPVQDYMRNPLSLARSKASQIGSAWPTERSSAIAEGRLTMIKSIGQVGSCIDPNDCREVPPGRSRGSLA
jgi:hypothetical protein